MTAEDIIQRHIDSQPGRTPTAKEILGWLAAAGYVVQHKIVGKRVVTPLGVVGTITGFEQDGDTWTVDVEPDEDRISEEEYARVEATVLRTLGRLN